MVNIKKPPVQKRRLGPAQLIDNAMRAHFLVLRTYGRTGTARRAEEFYGFRARDVIEMHHEKKGPGRGLWFRLKDGRLVHASGKTVHRAPSRQKSQKTAPLSGFGRTREEQTGSGWRSPLTEG